MPIAPAALPPSRLPGRPAQGLAGFHPGDLLGLAMGWLLGRPCPLCRQLPHATERQSRDSGASLCGTCAQKLALPQAGLSGQAPLNWWSSGSYAGSLRQTLLNQRRRADPRVIQALLEPLRQGLGTSLAQRQPHRPGQEPLLVPVPSWKRNPNPLPGLIAAELARSLGLRRLDLLARRHPVLGQHRLGRRLRQENQRGSFQLDPRHSWRQARPVLLVDDILTTGSTLQHAALCLREAGWPVIGAACLARTPDRRHWLRTP